MKITLLLILLCMLTTILFLFFNEIFPVEYLLFSGRNLMSGYIWTLVTSLFVHADLTHLIGNMLFLYVFGSAVESGVGSAKMVLAFFLGGALSFILSLYLYGFDTVMVGASAAIFTLAAIAMLIKPLKFSWLIFMPLGLAAMLYFLFNVFLALSVSDSIIGYHAHVIGFLVGVPLGISWSHGRWKINLVVTIMLLVIYLAIVETLFTLLKIAF